MTVVAVGEDDWERLRDIRLAALREAPEAFGSSIQRELGFTEKHWRMRLRSSAWFLALHDGDPFGLVCSMPEPGAPPHDRHVVALWVRPEHRGSGVAGRLLDAVRTWASTEGATSLSLWVTQDNERAAATYRRAGFVPTGVTMALPRDPSRTEERWTLELAGQVATDATT